MKKFATIMATMLITVAAMGQNITFDKTTHDFGKINEVDGRVTTIFTFTNDGDAPLVLSNVRASCGCTTPKWTREPIEPGQSGEITVTYNPAGRPGRFQKTVTVTSNTEQATTKLYIKGEVIPKPAQPAQIYPVKMGELNLKRRTISFGSLVQGTNKTQEVEYSNLTDHDITVAVLVKDDYIKPHVTLTTVKPGETGKIQITLASAECPLLGPVNTKLYVVVNGKREINDTYAITISSNIREDFSHLTVEERQKAPIAEIERDIHLGTIKQGKHGTFKMLLGNAGGGSPLYVRRIVMTDPMVIITPPKTAIKSGRKGEIKVDISTLSSADKAVESAHYSRVATIITNDPNTPIINVKINWVVE